MNGIDLSIVFPERLCSERVQAIWFASASDQNARACSRWLRGQAYTAVVFTLKGLFELSGEQQIKNAIVMPAYTQATDITLHPGTELIGICFPPGISTAIFGQRITRPTPLDRLNQPQGLSHQILPWHELIQALHDAPNRWRRALILYRWLTQAINIQEKGLPDALANTLAQLPELHGQDKLDQITADISFRQIERQFKRYIGISPKYYQRILRINRVREQLKQSPDVSLTEIAYQQGYSDQAHMIREFRAFNHITPKQYRAYLQSRDESR